MQDYFTRQPESRSQLCGADVPDCMRQFLESGGNITDSEQLKAVNMSEADYHKIDAICA